MTYSEAYTAIDTAIKQEIYKNTYTGGTDERTTFTLPYGEITIISCDSDISTTIGRSYVYGYDVVIRLVEKVRDNTLETTSESAVLKAKNILRDEASRRIIYNSGIENPSIKFSMGYASNGTKEKVLITIIKGEVR